MEVEKMLPQCGHFISNWTFSPHSTQNLIPLAIFVLHLEQVIISIEFCSKGLILLAIAPKAFPTTLPAPNPIPNPMPAFAIPPAD